MKIEKRLTVAYSLRKKNLSERTQLFFLGLPVIIMIFIFSYVPLFGWLLAFFDFKPGIPLSRTPFVGLKFFEMIISDSSDLLNALRNTCAFYLLNLITSPLPVVFAILLAEVRNTRFKKIVQTITTLPNFVSWVIVFALSFSIFSNDGLLNQLLINLKIISEPTNLLGNSDMAWIFQTLIGIWKGLGWGAIIYLSAITAIDSELYDAAEVDGAGRFRRIFHITVPGVAPTFIVMLILGISNLLSVGMEQYLVFYNGLVADKITVLDLYLYRTGILASDYSYSTAVGISKTFISIILLFIANTLAKKVRGYGII